MTADIDLGDNYDIDEDSNGNLVITDADGTEVLKHTDGGGWSLQAASGHSGADLSTGEVSVTDLVDTTELSVTNETLVRATVSSSQSLTAGSETRVAYDSTADDSRGEFDTSTNLWTPDDSGIYLVAASVNFEVGASGDRLEVRLRDEATDNTLLRALTTAGGTADENARVVGVIDAVGGNSHEITATNLDSDDTIGNFAFETYVHIQSLFS